MKLWSASTLHWSQPLTTNQSLFVPTLSLRQLIEASVLTRTDQLHPRRPRLLLFRMGRRSQGRQGRLAGRQKHLPRVLHGPRLTGNTHRGHARQKAHPET